MNGWKLTTQSGCTKNATQWGEGVTHTGTGKLLLCSAGYIHAYEDALVGIFMDPIHGKFGATARLWSADLAEPVLRDGPLKCGSRTVTTIREYKLPVVTLEHRIRFGVLAARGVLTRGEIPVWDAWADAYLAGDVRAEAAARAVAWAAEAARGVDLDLSALARVACGLPADWQPTPLG